MSPARRNTALKRCSQNTSSHESKLQAFIQIHYMYQTLSVTMIYLPKVPVHFFAITTQSETQKHVFTRILVRKYDFSGRKCNLSRLSLQFIFISTSRLLVSPVHRFSFYPVVQQMLRLQQTIDPRTYRPLWKRGTERLTTIKFIQTLSLHYGYLVNNHAPIGMQLSNIAVISNHTRFKRLASSATPQITH